MRGGDSKGGVYLLDEAFFEIMTETMESDPTNEKLPRIKNTELRELLSTQAKLTKEQRLLKSVLEEASLAKVISDKSF